MKSKEELRTEFRAQRRRITDKENKSGRILQALLSLPSYRTAATVALYASLPDEANTRSMIKAALESGKTVCLPKTEKKNMQFYQITAQSRFQRGKLGIMEPVSETILPADKIDLIIVPFLAADKDNYRLGFGGGYYDRYLSTFHGVSIGIGFQEQISLTPLPHESYDIPLQIVLTDVSCNKHLSIAKNVPR